MYRVGLAGGIGSGKSEVARLLAARGAVVVEADAIARELVAPGSAVLRSLVTEFGPSAITPDGALDRAAVAAIAFASESALLRLNAIVHPPLVDAVIARMEAEERAHDRGVLVVAAALLVQWDITDLFDLVVVVTAPLETRLERLARAGLSREEALARMKAQLPDDRLVEAADVVVRNDGSRADLEARVESVWRSLQENEGALR